MEDKKIRLALLYILLIALNGCGDNSSNKQEESFTQKEQEVNHQNAREAPIIALKGDSQVDIIEGETFNDLGASAVDSEGKALKVSCLGKVDINKEGSYTLVYTAEDSEGNISTLIRIVQVLSSKNDDAIKNYYLVPITKKSIALSNVNLVSGEVNLREKDVPERGNLSIIRFYNSYDDKDKTLGTFKINYESKLDSPLIENIKSDSYDSIDASCSEGWYDIDEDAFLGKLENAQPVFNHETSLCDIYDNGELSASLMIKHVRSGKSNHLHTLTRPDGSTYVFFKKNHKWRTISKTSLSLFDTDYGYKLINLDNEIEKYNKEGRLWSLTSNGKTITLKYSRRGELRFIVNSLGKRIQLKYRHGLLVKIISYDGRKIHYSYNNKKQLVQVRYEDGRKKGYTYNSKGDLESIIDGKGLITKTVDYENNGKAKVIVDFEYIEEKLW